jgi:antitoxin (DNA-binding transcriptional repressor) of toxin-antitoxin stability system
MVTKLVGVKEFRQNIADFHKQAVKNGWRFIVLNRNRPIFDVRPLDKKEAVLEKLVFDVADARSDYKAGRVYTTSQVRRALGLSRK